MDRYCVVGVVIFHPCSAESAGSHVQSECPPPQKQVGENDTPQKQVGENDTPQKQVGENDKMGNTYASKQWATTIELNMNNGEVKRKSRYQ